MNFDSFAAFLAMGDHGLYVWLSYGAFVLVVAANVGSVRLARRRFFRQARAIERRSASAYVDRDVDRDSSAGGNPANSQTNSPA